MARTGTIKVQLEGPMRLMQQLHGHKPILREGERDCPTCNATGINPVDRGLVCPKCNGERKLTR